MKDKADNSREKKKNQLNQAYKSYADYAFANNETHHPHCENAALLLLRQIGRASLDSSGGDKEQSIVSLIIISFLSECLDPSKPPSSGESMSSLGNCRMEYSRKGLGTLCFTLDSAFVISKVSRAIGDSRTFHF